ncbi:hypothetical protein AB0D04_12380 [Streptomyces sp. NPDC048483]|uniref:hypothetical protein n=1 Tax=Streptomyces sp. NPDC048483 TaxID=3154927 RepID=UPI00341F9DE3
MVLHTRTAWLRAVAPVAVLALTLTACGDKKDASDAKDGARHDKASSPDSRAKPENEAPDPDKLDGLKSGHGKTRQFVEGGKKVTYEIAVQGVESELAAQARDLVRDPKDAKGLLADTVFVKYTLKGGGEVKGLPHVADNITVSSDGRPNTPPANAPKGLHGCEDPAGIGTWKSGQSHVLCHISLSPAAAKITEVRWAAKGDKDPLFWKFVNTG